MFTPTYVCREQLVQHHALHQPYLKVDMSHLTAFDQELAHSVTQQPAQYLAVFEKEVRTSVGLEAIFPWLIPFLQFLNQSKAQLLCRELLASTVGLEEPQQKGRNKYQVRGTIYISLAILRSSKSTTGAVHWMLQSDSYPSAERKTEFTCD